ncbi:GntR family transcriptional regulator [Streptomyces sp. NPDC101234]|uniref:GntR family transcriptional regulator n=1 Tax=Streptomyces sp. NPDC101234 TaxID=3366138 RepID=UPI0037F235FA
MSPVPESATASPNRSVATDHTSEELSPAERAYRAIRDRLVMLEVRRGAPVNEEQLGQSLGAGRTPVREALKRPQYERLISTCPRRGTFATEVDITDLAHISGVRQELEPLAAAQAARRATATDRATSTALREELENPGSRRYAAAELMRLGLQVHRAVYATTHNLYLEDALVRHDRLATRICCLSVDRLSDMAGDVEEHGPLIEAIVTGDSDRAAQFARGHVAGFERAIREAI